MDKESQLAALEKRCFALGLSASEVFNKAKVSSATLTRWRKDASKMRAATWLKVSRCLDDLEKAS